MIFRLCIPLDIERPDGALQASTKVDVHFVYERGKWRGQSTNPPMMTPLCDSLTEAMVTSAREILHEWSGKPAVV